VFFNQFDAECEAWVKGKAVLHDRSDTNLGVCAAANRAARQATREFLCFMNDDMVALPGWDVALQPYLRLADPLWLSGLAIEPGKCHPGVVGGRDYGTSPDTFDESRLLRDLEQLRRPYNVVSTWPPTVLPRANWEAIGGFDEAYFPGPGSDPDLAMKMYRSGCRHFIGVGTSLVYHFSRQTTGRFDGVPAVDPRRYFRRKWGMTMRRFLRRVIRRDAVITPRLARALGWPSLPPAPAGRAG
jgi:GT2 family glycosyltransferase